MLRSVNHAQVQTDVCRVGFFEPKPGHRRVSMRIGMTDIICCLLWLLAIVEIIWAAGKLGDLVVLALQLAGTGWV